MFNILIGFGIGVLCLGIPMIWQYRQYRKAIRAVSDKWKAINDEWGQRYTDLYDVWMEGVQPSNQQRQEWHLRNFTRQANEMMYKSLPDRETNTYGGIAALIDSAKPTSSKSDPSV